MNYEHLLIDQFCASLASDDYTLFDCGADIGIFTVLVRTRRMLKRIVAFEPSADSYPYANANLTPLAPSVSVLNCAVGEHVGLGRLVRPPHDQSDHARYMEMSDEGDIKVDTIDAQQATGNVAIKIDVEGGEMAVLRGARKTIETADNCTISLEAHPLVAQRIGRDPIEMLRYINAIRPFRFVCISRKAVWPIDDLSKDLLSPDQRDVWNIVAVST